MMQTAALQSSEFTEAIVATLLCSLDALADFYDRKRGPWIDELEDAVLESHPLLSGSAIEALHAIFDDFRSSLYPRVPMHRVS